MRPVHLLVLALGLGLLFTTPGRAGSPASTGIQATIGTAFTYQGRLTSGSAPASGAFDFRFVLYDAAVGGAQTGAIVTRDDVAVAGGLFTVALDFGALPPNTALFLEVAVRPGASTGEYTTLTPRQALTPVPSALYAARATTADSATSAVALTFPFSQTGDANGWLFTVRNDGSGGAIRADVGAASTGSAITAYNFGTDRYGLEVEILNNTNPRAAIYARTNGSGQAIDAEVNVNTNADALFARTTSSSASSFAGVFVGNVSVSGTLSKSAGSFKIDHPLDPANKYLQHSFVESPDMKNIYDGVVTLDGSGAATVTLPDYFGALNKDFRYQLTAIGAPGPNLYIAQEVQGNQFRIAGGSPGTKVSWQVTGTRHDAYAIANRIQVEVDKPAGERGTYLFPQLFGKPASAGLDRVERPVSAPSAEAGR